MESAGDEAKRAISLALVAAVVVRPLDAWLTEDELKEVVTGYGISPLVFREVIHGELSARCDTRHPDYEKLRPNGLDLTRLMMFGGEKYPAVFSMATVARLAAAFSRLEKQMGEKSGVTLELLLAEAGGDADTVERALGFLLTLNHVTLNGNRFVRRLPLDGNYGGNAASHPADEKLERMTGLVRVVVAARSGNASPASPPTQRFFLFLRKQGWEAFASWWALTVRELETTADYAPTATTVLAGALLEAALVAIAGPARAANEWRQEWLEKDPQEWQLKALIKQAESAQTFSQTDAELARTLASLRNRIHAGRFSTAGRPPFAPQYTNAHEAKIARLHLDLLITKILEWGPIARLC